MTGERPSRWLEAFARFCLGALDDDCRLGDLSELHVQSHAEVGARLDGVPGSALAARVAADAHYLGATVEVMVFARGIDPGLQLYENGAAALAVLDLREKTMAMLQVAVRRFALPALLLVCGALMLNNAVDSWHAWRQAESLMTSAQREKAETAARGLQLLNGELNRVLGWAAFWFVRQPADQRHTDNVRMLLQQEPAILQLTQLDGQGRERLVVNRYSPDVIGSNIDRSTDATFVGVRNGGRYVGPVHADIHGDPVVTIAFAPRGSAAGAIIAELSLKAPQDIVAAVTPKDGTAYLVNGEGQRILTAGVNGTGAIRSVSANVPGTDWKVVVDVPTAVYDVPERNAAIRAISTAGLALVAVVLALVLALRPILPVRPVAA